MRDFYELIREIKNLNMGAEIRVGSPLYDPQATDRIFSSIPGDELVLPEGFYYNDKNGITNKHNVSLYTSIYVQDIGYANEATHDILEVGLDGLTNEERNGMPENFEEEANLSLRDRLVRTINNSGEKLVYKAKGLYQRVKNKLKYEVSKRKKVDLKSEIEEANKTSVENEKEAIKRVLKGMENDEYIIGRIKDELGSSISDALKNNPSDLLDALKDYDLIRVLHNFAVKDTNYNEDIFRSLADKAIDIKETNPLKINRLLQDIRYGNIEENQMQYLSEKLYDIEKNISGGIKKKKKKRFGGTSTKEEGTTITVPTPTIVEEPIPIKEEKVAETITLSEADKRSAAVAKEFSEKKAELFNKLGDYEKAFIDDAAAEGLDPSDNEFRQMINERVVNQDAILNYLRDVENLKKELAFKELDEYEQMFVDDAKAENLDPSDNEFGQMINERTVNKERVLNYYTKIKNANAMQDKINSFIPKTNEVTNNDSPELQEIKKMRERMQQLVRNKDDLSEEQGGFKK